MLPDNLISSTVHVCVGFPVKTDPFLSGVKSGCWRMSSRKNGRVWELHTGALRMLNARNEPT